MKQFDMICAVGLNGVIGDSVTNSMPWYVPEDLAHFKSITQNKTVIMGSRTFSSIGRKLPNRNNIVITRGKQIQLENGDVPDEIFNSFTEAWKSVESGAMVIGGQHIFQEAMRYGPRALYLTIIFDEPAGDVIFPISGRTAKAEYFYQGCYKFSEESRSEVFTSVSGVQYQFVKFANTTQKELRA
jgi:dihydrofolate reductase